MKYNDTYKALERTIKSEMDKQGFVFNPQHPDYLGYNEHLESMDRIETAKFIAHDEDSNYMIFFDLDDENERIEAVREWIDDTLENSDSLIIKPHVIEALSPKEEFKMECEDEERYERSLRRDDEF